MIRGLFLGSRKYKILNGDNFDKMLGVCVRPLSDLGETFLNSSFADFGKSYCAIIQETRRQTLKSSTIRRFMGM